MADHDEDDDGSPDMTAIVSALAQQQQRVRSQSDTFSVHFAAYLCQTFRGGGLSYIHIWISEIAPIAVLLGQGG